MFGALFSSIELGMICIFVNIAFVSAYQFILLGDWGGESSYPYTTPAQVSRGSCVFGDR
jgi:hypothetical protein